MTRSALLLCILLSIQLPPAYAQSVGTAGSLQLQRLDTGAGAELLTLVSDRGSGPEPMLSILRDTLGDDDPTNDKIRHIWVLTYARPSILQRLKASLPFFYLRSGNAINTDKPPQPILDYSASSRRALTSVLGKVLQRGFLNTSDLTRAPSSTYQINADEYRNARISQSLEAVAAADLEGELPGLSSDDLERIQGRLILTQRLLGDLTSETYLSVAKEQHDLRNNAMRAANWELLRQKAEENGLYFQPIHFGSREASYVLLWLAREDLAGPHRAFEKQLLQIPSPWNDKRMAGIDYSETWSFDEEGRRVEGDSPGAYQVEVIPLALYSLNHPKAPLLMADFRDQHKVRRSEMRRRVLDDTIGVLSWGFFSSWTFLGPRRAWTMLSGRWGAPINRQARLKAYSNLRSEIARDSSLDPRLRGLIAKSVDHLSINPFERSLAELSKLSSEQYQALSIWAQSPNGLAAKLERDRRAEMTSMAHGKAARGLFTLARIASFNFYRHLEEPTPERIAQLDRRRRIAYHTARLRELLESSPKPEVLASVHDLEQSVETLTLLVEQEPSGAKQVAKLVSQLFRKTSDDGLRRQSMDSLVRMQHDEADKELAKLMSEPAISASLGSAQLRIEDQAAGLEDARNGADAQ